MLGKLIGKISTKKKQDLGIFFNPKSIAVIGASSNTSKIGGFIFSQIKELKGVKTYPINVKFKKIQEIDAYCNITEIKSKVDLVIIAIPRDFVIPAIDDCIKIGAKNLIIISAGFKETGVEGAKLEDEIKMKIIENNLNVIGPNCLGILNAQNNLNCSFAKECPISGDIALVSQSGAVIDAIIDWSFNENIGFSKIVSLGNMAGVDSLEILKYLKNDDKTSAVVFYMETLSNGDEFAKVLKETSKTKPVIIIKPGSSDNAKAAIGSHTGSLAQDNILAKTLIQENGGIFVETLDELFNVLIGLKTNLPKSNELMIVTNAGGLGVIATDFASQNNFDMLRLSKKQKERFNFLPASASLNNPIDILGDASPQRYKDALAEIEKLNKVDNVLVLLTPQIMTNSLEVAKCIVDIAKKSKKSIYTCFLGGKQISDAIKYLENNGVAHFRTPNDAINAMDFLYKYNSQELSKKSIQYSFDKQIVDVISAELNSYKGLLDFNMTKRVLDVFKINLPSKKIIDSIDEALSLEASPHCNYVLKVDSPDLIHKIDVGGVILGVKSSHVKDKVIEMFDNISKITSNFSITVEEEFSGIEVIVGLKKEPSLGNFMAFGLGGTNVEIYNDVHFATCPLDKKGAKRLVENTKAYKLLNGFRGTKKIDFEHLYEILIRISYLQKVFPQIKEVDLNPVICSKKGIFLVDVKLII